MKAETVEQIVELSVGQTICLETSAGPVSICLNRVQRRFLAVFGFEAKREVTILRKELHDAIQAGRKS